MSKAKNDKKTCSKSCCNSKPKSWLFIVKAFEETQDPSSPAHIVHLRHPRTRERAMYMFSPRNEIIQEILTCDDPKRSYFIDNQVKSDGRLFLSTPIDPLFLALPYLKEYGRCSPLDQILTDEEYPEIERLLSCTGLKYIHHIADKKGDDSLNAYLYNEDKAIQWLEKKVKRVASALKDKGFHVSSSNAVSANFLVSRSAVDTEDSYLRYACGIISDYLPDSITTVLEKHLNLPPTEAEKKRKTDETDSNGVKHKIKKKKLDEDDEVQISSSPSLPKEKKATPSAKEKARAKAASGSKSITSFFKKK